MCCWIVLAWAFAPRFVLVMMAIMNDRITAAFGDIWLPLFGFLLMPWTTLVYTLTSPGGFTVLDYLLIAIAVLADLGAWGGGASERARRSR